MPLFLFILIFMYGSILITFIQYTHPRRHSPRLLSFSSSLVSAAGKTSRGAEPGNELGPALQQSDALPTELRRISYLYW
jgi:hypothetical protein